MTPELTMLTPNAHGRPGTRPAAAFTLVELMISIAIVVILILGVQFMFKTAADAASTGQALSEAVRQHRNAQSIFRRDAQVMAIDGPAIIIRSARVAAFRNNADELSDRDFTTALTGAARDDAIRSMDFDGDNVETVASESVPRTMLHPRNHRIDSLSFFATGEFRRQTGNDGVYAANQTSGEAWIWYGPLAIYDGAGGINAAGSYPDPGDAHTTANPNPYNQYASQWILGRAVILLEDKDGSNVIYDDSQPAPGIPQKYIDRSVLVANLSPLSFGSQEDGAGPVTIETSRYDLAATTISQYATRLGAYIAANPDQTVVAGQWWQYLFASPSRRFWCIPAPERPITSARAARTSSIFMPGCSQFVVEYAGDFLTQDAAGNVTGTTPDGVVDFLVDDTTEPALPQRRTRWYGFPRDLNNDGHILGYASGRPANAMVDVVPLRDVLMTAGGAAPPFEKDIDADLPVKADYVVNGIAYDAQYVAAWGPTPDPSATSPRPKMLRITLMLEDAAGRLGDAQAYEYVLNLPSQ